MDLDPSQQAAVDLMCSAPFSIVTGGPGTGKSTCLGAALDVFDRERQTYALAAPTGKAAKRMQEATGRRASTIHRMLGYQRGRFGIPDWTHNSGNPLPVDVVIVDEASMIDVELGASLLSAIGPRSRVVLIGDANQLPPVGPGRLFGDLVDSGAVPIARLTTLHRSARESWVAVNAPRILDGTPLDLERRHDFRYIEIAEAAHILGCVRELCTSTKTAIGDSVDVQVLIPQRPGVAGIEAANVTLQNALNPRAPDDVYIPRAKSELRLGDRVIQTKNNYDLGIFNGEVGEITELTRSAVTVSREGDPDVTFTLEQSNQLQHAYALTVHRSQGSEFPWVVVVCHSTHSFILSRHLLYTAITRAKKGVILVGDQKGLGRALGDARPPKRNTGLCQRLAGTLEGVPAELEEASP